jgi:hypothetical protein
MICTSVYQSSSWNIKRYRAINGKVRIKLEEFQSGKILRLKGIQASTVLGMVIC